MKLIINILLFLLIIFGISSCKKKEKMIQVSGKIIDGETGLYVAGVQIRKSSTTSTYAGGDPIAQSDASGNYSFQYLCDEENPDGCNYSIVLTKTGYGGNTGGEGINITSKKDLENYNLLFHPNTFLSFVITKTTIADSVITIRYVLPNWVHTAVSVSLTNSNNTDTLTLLARAGMSNRFDLDISRYNLYPYMTPYATSSDIQNVYCNSDTTYRFLNY